MSERLKPCPLCGEALIIREDTYQGETYHTAYCHCGFTFKDDGPLEDFLSRLNRRTPDIVACGECQSWSRDSTKLPDGTLPDWGRCEIQLDPDTEFERVTLENDFCSYGQRRESEEPNG